MLTHFAAPASTLSYLLCPRSIAVVTTVRETQEPLR